MINLAGKISRSEIGIRFETTWIPSAIYCRVVMNRPAAAEGYAQRGWQVFPCKVGGKPPATRSGLYAGTDDLVTVRRWWRNTDYNIGINCGASGLIVIDLDVDERKGLPGLSGWLDFADAFQLPWEESYCVVTPKGGVHIYYATEVPLRTTTSELAPNIDTRALGGYVLAAGSVVNGSGYHHFGTDEPLPAPSIIVERFAPRPPPSFEEVLERARYDARGTDDQREAAIRGLIDQVLYADVGERNNVLNWAASRVTLKPWVDDMKENAYERLEAAGKAVGLTEREVEDTIRSARRV